MRLLFAGKLNSRGGIDPARGGGSVRVGNGNKPTLGVRKWTGWESESTKGLAGERGSGLDQV